MGFGNLSSVATDDVEASMCAVDFLIGRGHRRIGILGGDTALSHTSKQRLEGCRKSFEKTDLPKNRKRFMRKRVSPMRVLIRQ